MAPRRRKDKQQKLATPGVIGARISNYRQEKGLDYDDMIEVCRGTWRSPGFKGVSRSWLMRLERGRVRDLNAFTVHVLNTEGKLEPRVGGFPAIAARLCKLFGCTPTDLLEDRS